MPNPCSYFYFDIKFGNRLYSKEKRPGFPLWNIIYYQNWYQSKSDYMDRAILCQIDLETYFFVQTWIDLKDKILEKKVFRISNHFVLD